MKNLFAAVCLLTAGAAAAQYNESAGRSAPAPASVTIEERNAKGDVVRVRTEKRDPARDTHGNAQGQQYDLAVDGAFTGQTIFVVDLYGQSFDGPRQAVAEKGFSVVRVQSPPPVAEFKKMLSKANQFWLLANCNDTVALTRAHHEAVRAFYEAGHGVYLWGDNDPCNADADKLASFLIDARVKGDLPGDQTVGLSRGAGKPGVVRDHLLSTGVEFVYEGVTVATVKPSGAMTPVIYGSAGNLVAAAYEKGGRRLIVDGGYTRLSYKWNTAGTGRYIKNAASWLANYERFGNAVVAEQFKKAR